MRYKSEAMKEEFLQYIWANSLFKSDELVTESHKKIEILETGQYNRDAGPDFFNAHIRMGKVILVGNIEIHLKSSDWYHHGHHTDKAYNNVILSVVRENDMKVYTEAGSEVECMVLDYVDNLYSEYIFMKSTSRRPGCFRQLEYLDDVGFYMTLESLAVERLERKVKDIRKIIEQTGHDWEECFYRLLCKYWSANINSEAFYQLSLCLPYKILLKYADRPFTLEALLFGSSGILETAPDDDYTLELKKEYRYLKQKHKLWTMQPSQWKFMRIRPDAFPTLRLALLAVLLSRFGHLLVDILETFNLKDIHVLLRSRASVYWETHYVFGRNSVPKIKCLGNDACKTILINAVIPFMFVYGKERGEEKYVEKAMEWLEQAEAEKNYIVREWEKYGFVFDSALQTQALIQLRKEYCDRHRCMQCRIGKQILANFRIVGED